MFIGRSTWVLINAIMLLTTMRVWLRSTTSIAWRLSHFDAQTRFLMRCVWRCLLRGLRPATALVVLCSILPWSLWGCARHAELPFNIPRVTVCMNAPPVHPDAKVSAYHEASNTWAFEDEDDIEDFEEFVQYADIIFLRDATAPSESVAAFPVPYNLLSCDAAHPLLPRVVYSDQRLPHANESALAQAGRVHMNTTIEDASALSRHFFGMPAGSAKKGPEIIPVCTRPPDVRSDALEWLFTTETEGASYTKDANLYARLRAGAKRVYVFDANAPAESVLRFTAPYNRLRCPGKPLVGDKLPNDGNKKAAFDALVAAVTAKASVSEFGGNGGSDKRTWTSGPDGSGASLSFFESVVRQMVIAGAFQSGDIDGNIKNPNGSRYGIPNGKNVGGADSLMLQLTAGTFMMLKTPLRTMGGFINKVASGLKRGGCLIIADVKLFPKKLAERLVETFGWSMAPSLHQAQTIMPFSRASMFTKGWESLYQAHKILEKDMWKKAFDREDFEDLPAIILKDAQHKEITKTLNEVRAAWLRDEAKRLKSKKIPEITPEGLWEIYQKAYKDHPEWLRAIRSYFGK